MRRIAMLACCATLLSGCVSVNKGNRPMGSIIGQNDLPEPGQWCRATYPQQRSGLAIYQGQVTGRVETVDAEGIHLTQVEGRMMSGAVGGLNRIPYISRLFRNTGVGREDSRIVKPADVETLEILSEAELRQQFPQSVAEQLTKAVPGPRWLARR